MQREPVLSDREAGSVKIHAVPQEPRPLGANVTKENNASFYRQSQFWGLARRSAAAVVPELPLSAGLPLRE